MRGKRDSGDSRHLSPILKSDVNKFEKNLESDPDEVPKKWHWNWQEAKLTYCGLKNHVKVLKDKPRYGYDSTKLGSPFF